MADADRADAPKLLPPFGFAIAALVLGLVSGGAVLWWTSQSAMTPAPVTMPAPPAAPLVGQLVPPRAVSFELLGDWRFPGDATADETAGLQRPGYLSATPPAAIAALDGVRIAIDGFVLPVELGAGDRITSAMLLRHQLGCGYGRAPTASQRIAVTLGPTARIDLRSGLPAHAVGVLRVNAAPSGAYPALYRMELESLEFTTGYNPDDPALAGD